MIIVLAKLYHDLERFFILPRECQTAERAEAMSIFGPKAISNPRLYNFCDAFKLTFGTRLCLMKSRDLHVREIPC